MCLLLLVGRVSWPQAERSGSWPRSKERSTRSSWGKSTRAGRVGERALPAGGGGGGGGAPGCPPPEYSRLSSEKRICIFSGFRIRIRIGLRFRQVSWSGSVFGIRIQEGKNDRQKWKILWNFMFWRAGCSLLRAEGFFCNLEVLYGGLGIGKL